ncbi:MAG: DUF1697 domain-containing protein, partial [Candidatus Eisenbacteria bacterium]|nr:DUF1697 domain-containing protein [Candidatus Eisenbacteria bacterium]
MPTRTRASRQVAFLRGINVGKAKPVAMADLRAVVKGLGFTDVATLLNSGNLVYTASVAPASAAASIENAIAEELEVESRVTALTAAELRSILDENPLAGKADNPSRHLIGV